MLMLLPLAAAARAQNSAGKPAEMAVPPQNAHGSGTVSAPAATAPNQASQTGRSSATAPSATADKSSASSPAPASPTPATAPPAPPVPVTTEVGKINGASFRIDIPKNWNHGLVLYFHGYQQTAQVFDPKYPPTRVLQEMLNRGYAVARSGYAVGGWAVPQAATETDALRRYFRKKYGQPRETFLMGHSMGGLLTLMGLETDAKDYAGGLALCGVLAPADLMMQRAFANRVALMPSFRMCCRMWSTSHRPSR